LADESQAKVRERKDMEAEKSKNVAVASKDNVKKVSVPRKKDEFFGAPTKKPFASYAAKLRVVPQQKRTEGREREGKQKIPSPSLPSPTAVASPAAEISPVVIVADSKCEAEKQKEGKLLCFSPLSPPPGVVATSVAPTTTGSQAEKQRKLHFSCPPSPPSQRRIQAGHSRFTERFLCGKTVFTCFSQPSRFAVLSEEKDGSFDEKKIEKPELVVDGGPLAPRKGEKNYLPQPTRQKLEKKREDPLSSLPQSRVEKDREFPLSSLCSFSCKHEEEATEKVCVPQKIEKEKSLRIFKQSPLVSFEKVSPLRTSPSLAPTADDKCAFATAVAAETVVSFSDANKLTKTSGRVTYTDISRPPPPLGFTFDPRQPPPGLCSVAAAKPVTNSSDADGCTARALASEGSKDNRKVSPVGKISCSHDIESLGKVGPPLRPLRAYETLPDLSRPKPVLDPSWAPHIDDSLVSVGGVVDTQGAVAAVHVHVKLPRNPLFKTKRWTLSLKRKKSMKCFNHRYMIFARKREIKMDTKHFKVFVNSSLTEGKFYVASLQLNGCRVGATFLDTGSQISILPKKAALAAGLHYQSMKKYPPCIISGFSGHKMSSLGAYKFTVTFEGKKFKAPQIFHIVDRQSHEIILGKDFIVKNKASILCNNSTHSYSNAKWVLTLPRPRPPQPPSSPLPPGTARSHSGSAKEEHVEITFSMKEENAHLANYDTFSLEALEVKDIQISHPKANCSTYVVEAEEPSYEKPFTIVTVLSNLTSDKRLCVRVANLTTRPVKIAKNELKLCARPFQHEKESIFTCAEALKVGQENDMYVEMDSVHFPSDNVLEPEIGIPTFEQRKSLDECLAEAAFPADAKDIVDDLFKVRYTDVVAKDAFDAGNASARGLGKIELISAAKPAGKIRTYPLSTKHREHLLLLLQTMTRRKWMEPIYSSAVACPSFLIPKKDPTKPARLLLDLRKCNEAMTHIPISTLTSPYEVLQRLGQSTMFSTIDMANAYYSLSLTPEAADKTVFATCFGLYRMLRLPQGHCNSPGHFSSIITQIITCDEALGHVECFSPPSKYVGVPPKANPYSNLQNHVVCWLDDLLVHTACQGTRTEQLEFHATVLSRLLGKLLYYDFRVDLKKAKLFQDSIEILGHTISQNRITPDPKYKQAILDTSFPTSKVGLQRFLGVIAFIRPSLPPAVIAELEPLYELTSVKSAFAPQDKHKKAFELAKAAISKAPTFTHMPDDRHLKLMYCDASTSLLGGILFQVEFDGPFVSRVDQPVLPHRPFSRFDGIGRQLLRLGLHDDVHMSTLTPTDGSCFFWAVCDQLKQYESHPHLPQHGDDLRLTLTDYMYGYSKRTEFEPLVTAAGYANWQDFVKAMAKPCTPTDDQSIVIRAMADLLSLDIVILTDSVAASNPVICFQNTTAATPKPPLFIAFYSPSTQNGVGHFQSLCVLKPSKLLGRFCSLDRVVEWQHCSRDTLFDAIKKSLKQPTTPKIVLKLLACFSKSIPAPKVHEPIAMLELQALLLSLNYFKHLFEGAPATLVCIDSRAVHLLLSKNSINTSQKLPRWCLAIRQKYPKLFFFLVGTRENAADFFSRIEVSGLARDQVRRGHTRPLTSDTGDQVESDQIEQHGHTRPPSCGRTCSPSRTHSPPPPTRRTQTPTNETNESSTLTDQILSFDECEKKCNQIDLSDTEQPFFNDLIIPLRALKDRLSINNIIKFQKVELKEQIKKAQLEPNEEFSLENNVLGKIIDNDFKIYVPPSLEGALLAYEHLIGLHKPGREQLINKIKLYYTFPKIRKKVEQLTSACSTCRVMYPIKARKSPCALIPTPDHAFQTLFIDFLFLEARTKLRGHSYLIICDSFSRYITAYAVRDQSELTVIKCLKLYFMHFGLQTRIVVADNQSSFRSKKLKIWLSSIGIRMIASPAFRSQSRSLVEAANGIIRRSMSAVALKHSHFKVDDVLWFVILALNQTVNNTTTFAPFQSIFGTKSLLRTNIGLDLPTPILEGTLLPKSFKSEIIDLAKEIEGLWDYIKTQTIKYKLKEQQRANKFRKVKSFKEGQIVFIRDFRPAADGRTKALRPILQSSPFIIERLGHSVAFIRRLADGLRTVMHLDHMKAFKPQEKDDPLYKEIPDAVKEVLGQPLTEENIKRLAEIDKLPPIYSKFGVSPVPELGVGVLTRARRRRLELDQIAENLREEQGEEEDEEEEGEEDERRVHFSNDQNTSSPEPSPAPQKEE
jgi:transposase InsO family protein